MTLPRAARPVTPWRWARAALLAVACALTACAAGAETATLAETPGISVRRVAVLDGSDTRRFHSFLRVAWSPDGTRIAAFGLLDPPLGPLGDGPYAAALWDAQSGRRVALLPHPGPGPGTHGLRIGFSRDGRIFFLPAGEMPGAPRAERNPILLDHLLLVDAATGRPSGTVSSGLPQPPPAAQPEYLAIAPEADRAVAAFGNGLPGGSRVVVFEAGADGSWKPRPFFTTPPDRVAGFVFAPSGAPLLGVLRYEPIPMSAKGSPPRLMAEVRGPDGAALWSVPVEMRNAGQSFTWGRGPGEGRLFVGASGTSGDDGTTEGNRVVALDAATGARLWTARWHAGLTVHALAASPDGTMLAAISAGLAVLPRILRAADGATLAWLPDLERLTIGGAAWSPDGRHLAVNDGGRIVILRIETK